MAQVAIASKSKMTRVSVVAGILIATCSCFAAVEDDHVASINPSLTLTLKLNYKYIMNTVCVLVFSCLFLCCFGNRGFILAGIPGPFAQERHVPDERRHVDQIRLQNLDQQSQGQNIPTNYLPTEPNIQQPSLTTTTSLPPTHPNTQQPNPAATAIPPPNDTNTQQLNPAATTSPLPTHPNTQQPDSVATAIPLPAEPNVRQPTNPPATPPHTSVVDPEVQSKKEFTMDSGPPLFQDCTIENLTINSITITKNTCPSHPPNTGVPPAGVGSSTPEEPTSGSPAVNGSNQAVTENRPQLVSSPRPDPSNAEIVCGNNFYQCTDTRSQLSDPDSAYTTTAVQCSSTTSASSHVNPLPNFLPENGTNAENRHADMHVGLMTGSDVPSQAHCCLSQVTESVMPFHEFGSCQ